jgi:transposase
MDPSRAQEIAERDQLWASLRALRPEIEALAAGGFEPTERHRQLVVLLARIVASELDFRGRDASPEG